MANLTPAERTKRYRQRKAGNKVAASPRSARRAEVEILWMADCMAGNKCSLRTFYRHRRTVLRFARDATNQQLIDRLTAAPEIVQHIRNHMIVSEWGLLLARLAALGVLVEDMRHPLLDKRI